MWLARQCFAGLFVDDDNWGDVQEPFTVQDVGYVAPPVINTFSQIWRPLIARGEIERTGSSGHVLKTFEINAFLESAEKFKAKTLQSPGVHVVSERNISDEFLDTIAKEIDVSSICGGRVVKLNARKLVAYSSECTNICQLHMSKRHPYSLCTVDVILNSAYTGGEIQAVYNGQVVDLNGAPGTWVAVHVDVPCLINPVTSGQRVSLIYDVFAEMQIGPYELAVAATYEYSKWDQRIFGDLPLSSEASMPTLIRAAENLRPDLVGMRHLIMDASVLNTTSLKEIAQFTNQNKRRGPLRRLFPTRKLDIRPTHLVIHRTEASGGQCTSHVGNERGKGYLGTLVIVVGPPFEGGDVHFYREDALDRWVQNIHRCYAYAAGTTQKLKPIIRGTRITLHFDVYDAGSIIPIHNPFASTCVEGTKILTRVTASATINKKVLSAMQAQLAEANTTVIITLQDTYHLGVQRETLQGGDRALYDILSSHATMQVDFVDVVLHYRLDPTLNERILETCSCTFTSGSSKTGSSGTGNTKFIVPTYLTSKHRAEGNSDILGPYFVKGLNVKKK